MKTLLFAAALCAMPLWAQAPPAPAKPKPAAPPARIREFKASRATLQAGQSTTLSWQVENPTTTTLTGVGSVAAIGNRTVSPKATTTYTLTVRGANGEESRSLTVTIPGTTAVTATAAEAQAIPRMADGKPDMSGIYNNGGGFSQMFGGRATRGTSNPITAKLKPGAEKYKVVRGANDAGQYAMCSPTATPGAYMVPYQWQIVQGRDAVVIMYEYPHLFRAIPISSAANPVEHPEDPDPTWQGNSVGHWEGDTLVVDVVGFNDKTELPGGFRHSEALHVVERFTRVVDGFLEWSATVDDPNVFVEPWTISRGYPLREDLQTMTEFICENNKDYKDLYEKK